MKGVLAPLDVNEERTFSRIGFGAQAELDRPHICRLLELGLIEWDGWSWRLSVLGRQRYDRLVATQPSSN